MDLMAVCSINQSPSMTVGTVKGDDTSHVRWENCLRDKQWYVLQTYASKTLPLSFPKRFFFFPTFHNRNKAISSLTDTGKYI